MTAKPKWFYKRISRKGKPIGPTVGAFASQEDALNEALRIIKYFGLHQRARIWKAK